MYNFGIIGNGVVGKATARLFMEWGEVRVYDEIPELRTHSLRDTVSSADFIFICLPTNWAYDEANGDYCDLSPIDEFFLRNSFNEEQTVVLRSTTPVGTVEKMRGQWKVDLLHWPEFLTARCAYVDAQTPARNVIGGYFESPGMPRLQALLASRFPGVPTVCCSPSESELIKLATNAYFSQKIAFFNDINLLCRIERFDWDIVREGILSDGRIAHSHTRVPGPDGQYGFGGACLPKDLRSLEQAFEDASLSTMLTAVRLVNQSHRQL